MNLEGQEPPEAHANVANQLGIITLIPREDDTKIQKETPPVGFRESEAGEGEAFEEAQERSKERSSLY